MLTVGGTEMKRLLLLLQIGILVLIGAIVGEAVLWALWTRHDVALGLLVSAIVGYAGFLSAMLAGGRDAALRRAFAWIWSKACASQS